MTVDDVPAIVARLMRAVEEMDVAASPTVNRPPMTRQAGAKSRSTGSYSPVGRASSGSEVRQTRRPKSAVLMRQ